MNLKAHIREISDFPKPGILFYDISTLLAHANAWKAAIDGLAERLEPHRPDCLVGIESRGFLIGAPLAIRLGTGFYMVRKKGKLPGSVVAHAYDLEYGSDTIEISADLIQPGTRIAVVDDLLATGGTAQATIELLRKVGAEVVTTAFLIELTGLGGRARLGAPAESLITYEM